MTTNEKQMLDVLDEAGGKLHLMHLASRVGISSNYAGTIAGSLERRGYLDIPASISGKVTLTEKGWRALGKNPEGEPLNEKVSPGSQKGEYVRITY